MTHPLDAGGARRLARIGGVLYLGIIAIGAFGEVVVRGRVLVPGNAAQTAANLRSMEGLWRIGIAGEIVLLASALALALILYILLRPVSRHLAALAVLFNLIAIAIEGTATVALAAAVLPAATDGTVILLIRSHSLGFGIGLVFFGVECVILGILVAGSGYIPKWIGILMLIAGVCYVVNSFALILSPPLSSRLFPAILLPALAAELSLAVWLLVRGVRSDQWGQALALSCSPRP